MVVFFVVAAACGGSDGERSEPSTTTRPPATAPGPTIVDGTTRPLALGDPAAIPALDTSDAIVPLEEIVFDTFGSGPLRLSDADDAIVRQLLDAIPPLDAPSYESVEAADTWLRDDDVLLTYEDGSDRTWAYPVRILNFHEIVNDTLDDVPVLVSYCPLCASGVVYDRRLGGRELSFSNTGALHENDLVMVDRETGSYWWQVPGRGLVGPLAGEELTPLASTMVTWDGLRDGDDEVRVLQRPPRRDYSRDPFAGYADIVDAGSTPFPVSDDALTDGRLTPGTTVAVVTLDGQARAWPVSPARTIDDALGETTVTVETDGTGALVTTADGERVPVRVSMWFAVVASFPDVTVGP